MKQSRIKVTAQYQPAFSRLPSLQLRPPLSSSWTTPWWWTRGRPSLWPAWRRAETLLPLWRGWGREEKSSRRGASSMAARWPSPPSQWKTAAPTAAWRPTTSAILPRKPPTSWSEVRHWTHTAADVLRWEDSDDAMWLWGAEIFYIYLMMSLRLFAPQKVQNMIKEYTSKDSDSTLFNCRYAAAHSCCVSQSYTHTTETTD